MEIEKRVSQVSVTYDRIIVLEIGERTIYNHGYVNKETLYKKFGNAYCVGNKDFDRVRLTYIIIFTSRSPTEA